MNLPNKLTIFRIFLVPLLIFVWLFPYEQFNISFGYLEIGNIAISYLELIVLIIFCVASITDFLDGNIARKRKLITTFGKFADPIADKILVNTMLVIMTYKHMVPVVPIVLMICRDTIVDGCRMIAGNNGVVVSAGVLGKLKTVLQMCAIILTMLHNIPFEFYGLPVSTILIWFAAFVSVAGGISYFNQLKEYILESK